MNQRNFLILIILLLALAIGPSGVNIADAGPGGGTYYANSPAGFRTGPSGTYWTGTAIRKFVHTLPGLGSGNPNDLGQYITVANPDTGTFTGSDYYEIGLSDYTQQLHSDLAKATKLRGYYQINSGTTGPTDHSNKYLGPVIIAQKDRPVRIKFTNNLSVGTAGNLFIPVDTTSMGAGMGPDGLHIFTQNRATLHLHGSDTPWISDGTPHQWTAPVGENTTTYLKGVSARDVPDMPATTPGNLTFYYPNGQSSRLMFYHDHAYGITRLNVYAGEAAGYLLYDQVERDLIEGTNVSGANPSLASVIPNQGQAFGGVYHFGIPLIIQDKTFVPTDVAIQDALWNQDSNGVARPWIVAGGGAPGDLWFPHVYEPNQAPNSEDGANPFGRWDYGPWFWPPVIVAPQYSTLPEPSMVPEAFMDTPLVNGTPYPKLQVTQTAYRFRILNASNDRAWNLQLYYVDPLNPTEVKMVPAAPSATPCAPSAPVSAVTGLPTGCWPATWPTDGRAGGVPDPATAGPKIIQIGTEGGLLPAPVEIPAQPIGYLYDRRNIVVLNISDKALFLQPAERADVIVDFSQIPAGSKLILYNDAPAPVPGFDPRIDYYTGNPDYTSTGGAPTTIAGYGPNTRTIMQFEVVAGSGVAYNLAALQAAQPAAFATAQPAPIVPQSTFATPYNAPTDTYARIQDFSLTFKQLTPISGAQALRSVTVTSGGTGYSSAPSVTFTGGGCGATPTGTATVAGGAVTGVMLTNAGGTGCTSLPTVSFGGPGTGAAAVADFETLTLPMQTKAIQELWDPYGRMNATLGVEYPFTNNNVQTTIPLGYIDYPTEVVPDGQVQLWKITHNGVDTHPVHFHLFNVQLINRVGWDGAIRPPDANEIGWKETVRMNPLEDAVVALRAKKQPGLPFVMPTSQRVSDVTTAQGAPVTLITDPFASQGNPVTVNNPVLDYSWEYVWHCHILGHEENDFMRAMILEVPTAVPPAPLVLALDAATTSNAITLNWGYPGYNIGVAQPGLAQAFPNEPSGFRIERCAGAGCSDYAPISTISPSVRANTAPYAPSYITTYTDTKVAPNTVYGYRVTAVNAFGAAIPVTASATSASYASVTGLTLAKSPVAATYALGTTVTITPTPAFSAGAAVTPQYRFWVNNVMVQDYGVAGTYTFPASTLIGTYVVTADARTNLSSQTPDATSAPLSVVIVSPTPSASTLTITKAGTGSGTVTSNPAGITCGSTCSALFVPLSQVGIIASPDSTSSLIGFSGDCIANVSPCTIPSMDTLTKAVTVTFNLKADFAGTPISGANPLAVQFTDHSIAGASSWLWDFGDSTTSTLQNPDHVYATSAGYPVSYSVSLTANGATTTKANYITLTSSCTSDPVKVGVTPYLSISNAFNTVRSTNDVIQVMAVGQTGTLDWNQNITVELRGGYDCNFTTNSLGFTTVTPSLTISGGTLTIENLIVQ